MVPKYTICMAIPRIFTDSELESMRNTCSNALELAMFEFLRSTGCRVSEMLSVLKEDLNLDENEVYLRKTKAKVKWSKEVGPDGKKRFESIVEPRYAILDEIAVGAIMRYLKIRIFKPKSRVFLRTSRAVQNTVKRWAKDANLRHCEEIHPHIFRHTAATRMLAQGVPIPFIKQSLGWSKGSVTFEKYYEHTPRDIVRDTILNARKSKPKEPVEPRGVEGNEEG